MIKTLKTLLIASLLLPFLASAQTTGQFFPFLRWTNSTGTQATTTNLFSTKMAANGITVTGLTSGSVVPLVQIRTADNTNASKVLSLYSNSADWNVWLGTEAVPNIYIGGSSGVSQYFWRANWNNANVAANTFASAATDATQVPLEIVGQSSQSAHYLDVTKSGSTQGGIFKIDGSGHVGINTTSAPDGLFDVHGSTGDVYASFFNGNFGRLQIIASDDQNGKRWRLVTDNSAPDLELDTSGGNIRLLPVGFIGAGTSTPKWMFQIATSTAPQLTLSDGGANHWSFRSAGGNFYLATSSPTTYATSSANALSIDNNGLITEPNITGTLINGFNLSTCNSSASAITWTAGQFGCHTIAGGGGSGGGTWATSTIGQYFVNYPLNSTDVVVIGAQATGTAKFFFDPNISQANILGTASTSNLFVQGSSTLQNFTFVNATGSQATTSNFSTSVASSTTSFNDATSTTRHLVVTSNGTLNLNPSIQVGSNTGTGIYATAGGVLSLSSGGAVLSWDGTSLTPNNNDTKNLGGASNIWKQFWGDQATTSDATSTNSIFSNQVTGNTLRIGGSASSTINTAGDLLVVGSTTLQNFTYVNATGTNATTTALYSTLIRSADGAVGTPSITTNGVVGLYSAGGSTLGFTNGTAGLSWNGTGFYPNSNVVKTLGLSGTNEWLSLFATNASTTNATSTNATSTNFAVSGNASTSSLYLATAPCSGANALNVSSTGKVTCGALAPTAASVTSGAALTKTDDTNVTLTLGGSPSTALLGATSLTLGWTGTLADSRITSAANWNAKLSSYDAFTHPGSNTISATTSQMIFTNASSTFTGDLNITGNSTTTNATTTNLSVSGNASSTGLIVSGTRSALLLTGATGIVSGYAGASACSGNNFVTAISAVGGTTCGTAAISGINLGSNLADLTNGTGISAGGTYNGGTARTFSVDQSFSPTWTGAHIFNNITRSTSTDATSTNSIFSGQVTGNIARFGGTASSSFDTAGLGTFRGFISTASSTVIGNFTIASSSYLSVNTICLSADVCRTTWPAAGGGSPGGTATEIQYRSGATTFGAVTNSAFTTSGGWLGIGTTTPEWLLQLSTSTAPQLTLSDGLGTDDHWSFRNAGGILYLATSSATTFATSTGPAAFSITNTGLPRFGLGTSTPFASLSIVGNNDSRSPFIALFASTTNIYSNFPQLAITSSSTNFFFSSTTQQQGAVVNVGTTTQTVAGDLFNFYVNGRINYNSQMFSDDFMGQIVSVSANTNSIRQGLRFNIDGACTASSPSGVVQGMVGVLRMAAGSAGGNGCHLDFGDTNNFASSSLPFMEARVRWKTATTSQYEAIGFNNIASGATNATSSITAGIYMVFDPVVGKIQCVTRQSATVAATTTTNYFPTGAPITLDMGFSSSTAQFYVDGQMICNMNNGANVFPLTGIEPDIFIESLGATSATVDTGTLRVWANPGN